VLYAILKRGALLPIAPVVYRLTMRAIAVWSKDTPVGSPLQRADFVGQWRERLLASIWTSGLVLSAPWQLLVLAGPEHGRTIPLAVIRTLSVRGTATYDMETRQCVFRNVAAGPPKFRMQALYLPPLMVLCF
jgi:hypothetical protein